MNGKDSSNTSRTNWAALEAMDDDDINYSDIPPLTEAFFEKATLRLPMPMSEIPTHPGKILKDQLLQPMGITQQELADSIHVPLQPIEELISGYGSMTPGIALRLAKYFRTSASFWMNLQLRWDLHHAQQVESKALAAIQPRQLA